MRHRISHRKLNRTKEHRIALRRNQAQSLFEHGQIRTTIQKAKDLRPFVEKLITLAKKTRAGSLTARRQIHKLLSDRSLIPAEHQDAYDELSDAKRAKALRNASGRRYRTGEARGKQRFTGETVTHRLIETVAPKFADREGGYTRIVRLPDRRLGDHGELAILQLVGDEEAPGSLTRPQKTARRKRADARYAAAVKGVRKGGKSVATVNEPKTESPAGDAGADAESSES